MLRVRQTPVAFFSLARVSTIAAAAYRFVSLRCSIRNEVLASTSYFLNAGGTHQLKVGTDLDKSTFVSLNFTTGTPFDPNMCSPAYLGGSNASPGAPANTFIPAGSVCGAINRPSNGANSLYDVSTFVPTQKPLLWKS